MRATGPALSVTAHAALGVALLLGTVHGRPQEQPPSPLPPLVFPPTAGAVSGGDEALPPPPVPGPLDDAMRALSLPGTLPQFGEASPVPPGTFINATSTGAQPAGWGRLLSEQSPELLAGPKPAYPDLLRQAGIEGRVVLEAVVDTTGRVDRASIRIQLATNEGFVAAARQALLVSLFRPGRVDGRAVRVRVRVPYEFTLRGGTGSAQ